jgi:hypothetical protein
MWADHPYNGLTAVSGVAQPQGGWPAATFYPIGQPMPYASDLHHEIQENLHKFSHVPDSVLTTFICNQMYAKSPHYALRFVLFEMKLTVLNCNVRSHPFGPPGLDARRGVAQ